MDRVFERLRREYLDEMPGRLADLDASIRTGDEQALRTGLHQLAGSGGSHGFPEISVVARELERGLAEGGPDRAVQLKSGLERLRAAIAQARGLVG